MDKLGKILIVDDDISYLQSLKSALKNEFSISISSSIKEAKKLINKEINLFLFDIQLDENDSENRDGITLLKWIKNHKKYRNIPVVMISVHRDYIKKCKEMQADDFLPKPLNIPELKRVLKKLISKTNPIRD